MIWSEGLSFKSSPRYYNRRNSNVSPVVVAGVGLERLISTILLNPPLSSLRSFSLLRLGKTNEFVLLSL